MDMRLPGWCMCAAIEECVAGPPLPQALYQPLIGLFLFPHNFWILVALITTACAYVH